MNAATVFYIHSEAYYKPIMSARYVTEDGDRLSLIVYRSKLFLNGKKYKIKQKRNNTLIIRESEDYSQEALILKDTSAVRKYFTDGFLKEVEYKKDSLSS